MGSEPLGSFDWFLSPAYLLPLFEELTAETGKAARVLMLGCGNSELSEAVRFPSQNSTWHRLIGVDVRCRLVGYRQR